MGRSKRAVGQAGAGWRQPGRQPGGLILDMLAGRFLPISRRKSGAEYAPGAIRKSNWILRTALSFLKVALVQPMSPESCSLWPSCLALPPALWLVVNGLFLTEQPSKANQEQSDPGDGLHARGRTGAPRAKSPKRCLEHSGLCGVVCHRCALPPTLGCAHLCAGSHHLGMGHSGLNAVISRIAYRRVVGGAAIHQRGAPKN